MKCICGKEFEKSQSLNAHYSHCKVKRSIVGQKPIDRFAGKRGWAKGKTKETNLSLANMSNSLSLSLRGKKKKSLSKEHKEKISIARTNYLENNDSHCCWFSFNNGIRNIKVQGTWEKRFAEYLIKNKIRWDRFSIKYDGHRRYTPDFYLLDFNVYIEIKGWMKDRDIDKMQRFLKDNPTIDIKLVDSYEILSKIENDELSIQNLETFKNKYMRE